MYNYMTVSEFYIAWHEQFMRKSPISNMVTLLN